MNIAELVTDLTQQGIQLQANQDKLSIWAAKGALTPEVKAKLAEYKSEILSFLREADSATNLPISDCYQGMSLYTIGRLISGLSSASHETYRPPIVEATVMAQKLTMTFRPLPRNYHNSAILQFRQELQAKLESCGVTIEPWEKATIDFSYTLAIPALNWKKEISVPIVRMGISAVVDVERPPSLIRRLGTFIAETFYQIYTRFVAKGERLSIAKIAQLATWAEDHTALRVQDPTNTQVIILTDLNPEMANSDLEYSKKIKIGLNTLVKTFSEIVIGVADDKFSILNMNLSDSTFPRSEFDNFVLKSLIPKIFVPILPLPLSRFELGHFEPEQSIYAQKLVSLGKQLAETGLFPAGSKLTQVIKRKSHRDIVEVIMNGRTGVSYGFVAYLEPPQYVGAIDIDEAEWQTLAPVSGFSSETVRQNGSGRWYLKTSLSDRTVYKQIPDIWLVSSRSGANKTDLNLTKDVTRIGLQQRLLLQVPTGIDVQTSDVKPSYDVYVMVAIALAAALYTPELIKDGAPLIHFHGYPSADWFQEHEYCVGVNNPSVPCGTYESGVFNFLGICSLASKSDIALAALIEPDHGTNILAHDLDYLLDRLKAGCNNQIIELGGKYFSSLQQSNSVSRNDT